MQGRHVLLIGWIASLAVAWFAGQQLSGSGPGSASDLELTAENTQLREQLAALQRERGERGPVLDARGSAPGATGVAEGAPAGTGGAAPAEAPGGASPDGPVGPIDLASIQTPDELSKAFMAFAQAMLSKGREGHLELLAWIGKLGGKENEGEFKRIFARGGERELPGAIYPVVKFAIHHEQDVMALTETFFQQAAEKPAWFEGMGDDPFELFTQGIGMLAPGIADKEQMARMRGYAERILKQDEASQPQALRGNRRELERLLQLWTPPMPLEELLAKLQAGTLSDAEIGAMLPSLPPEAVKYVDLDRLLGPRLERGDWDAVRLLQRFPDLDATTRARMDQRVYRGAGGEHPAVQAWYFPQYLPATGRTTWEQQRSFFETGLGIEGTTAATLAEGIFQMGTRGPDKEWVRWALGRYRLPDEIARRLRMRFKLDD